ncbi:MAG: hypothetical protein AUG51_12765 [Acidobacteria bacterium 13_1_20CM_3_53_8]|nr:MAG: hypothetical protein AUG51_12765 [Acidobacteria bacterium 13_1_20CM_3_53_8]
MYTRLTETAVERQNERGAALITTLLFSILLLAAGGALILSTAMTVPNTVDAAAESQAYYAAEAGMQASINVLRGNVAPSPLFVTNPSGSIADGNKISFRGAVTRSTSNLSGDSSTYPLRLSQWLSYDSTYTDRVILSANYSPLSGLAYSTAVSDPDNSATVTFSTSGTFDNGTATKSWNITGNKATLTYNPQSASTINSSGTGTLGKIQISDVNHTVTLTNEPFTLTITQTAPWPATATISCLINGTITSNTSVLTVTFPSATNNTNNLEGTLYARASNPINTSTNTSMSVTVTAPQPRRLVVKVTGYGPRGATKNMQMIINRLALDFTPSSAITVRSSDNGTAASLNLGSSSQYTYTGNDHAGGTNLPALTITNSSDNTTASTLIPSGSTQVTGSPSYSQVSTTSLSSMLQTADGCRAAVDILRQMSLNQRAADCNGVVRNRYFTTSDTPCNFGASEPNGLLTFVDGDVDLQSGGGAGLLVVTGTLYMRGSADFKGLILVLGGGQLIRDGGGNGQTYGSIVIAKFDSTGGFLAPTFNSNGSGTADLFFDSDWVRKALAGTGPRVMGVSEY